MIIYVVIAMTALIAVTSLSVDWARVTLVKSELSSTANAAARAGAQSLIDQSVSTASATTVATAAMNSADGSAVALVPASDIEMGNWNDTTKMFIVGGSPTNGVRVTARRVATRNSAVPTGFIAILGRPATTDVTATATAAFLTSPLPSKVATKSNPWLAGMPEGTTANDYDSAPSASPALLASKGELVAGNELTFNATGTVSNQAGVEDEYEADGNLSWIIHNYPGNENGIADLKAPISSLIGVFLSDAQPNTMGTPPAKLDFTSAKSRNFSKLSPQLRQPFFIGDGKRSNGNMQKFVVPAGATRLYVGSMDGQQWSDNAGGFSVTIAGGATIYRVVTVE